MTYEEIFAAAKEGFLKKDVSGMDGHLAIQIDIIGEGEGAFYIELLNRKLYVEPYEYYDRDAKLIASADTFLGIANGTVNAVGAFTAGKLKVEGSIDKALEFQKIAEAPEIKAAPTAEEPKAEKSEKAKAEKAPKFGKAFKSGKAARA